MGDKQPDRLWTPSADQIQHSVINDFRATVASKTKKNFDDYSSLYKWSVIDNQRFWSEVWDYFDLIGDKGSAIYFENEVPVKAKWFPEAKLSFAENLLRYSKITPERTALIEVGEHGREHKLSYEELYCLVSQFAQYFISRDIKAGDVIAGITPNCVNAIAAMLAAASIGAIWTSCSPDFGVNGILDRFSQTEPKLLLACDGYYYANKMHKTIEKVSEVKNQLSCIKTVIVFPYLNNKDKNGNADVYEEWKSLKNCDQRANIEFVRRPFNDPLYILYSSGTTGKPKCITHGVGGTLIQHVKELGLHTNVNHNSVVFYYTTCGWMMWNWLVSSLSLGATLVLYDGSPFHKSQTVLFDLIDNYQISVFGASAKYYSACEKYDLNPRSTHKLTSLNTLLSTGSPLAPESFDYIYGSVKEDVCLSSISGGTDIISCFALGNPILPVYRGELQCIGLGMNVEFWDETGKPLKVGKGELVCKNTFPSMPVMFWKDENNQKYLKAYFQRFENVWAHGDYGEIIQHQNPDQIGVMIHGRSDAVLNPGGVRIGTAEIYRQVEKVNEVFESLAIGQEWDDDVRVVLFVRLKEGYRLNEELKNKITQTIRANTTPRHVPAKIISVSDIPRTLSGKIVELAVRNVVHGLPVNNTEALANPEALELFKNISELS